MFMSEIPMTDPWLQTLLKYRLDQNRILFGTFCSVQIARAAIRSILIDIAPTNAYIRWYFRRFLKLSGMKGTRVKTLFDAKK